MNLKTLNHVLFPAVMIFSSFAVADDIHCKYGQSELFHKFSCEIKSINARPKVANKIDGWYWTGESREDVLVISYDPIGLARLNLTKFDSIFCREFPNVEHIKLTGLTVSKTDENALQNCTMLEEFEMIDGNIKELPENFLPEPSKLRRLDLKQNKIVEISERLLYHQSHLEELDLESNQIKTLEEDCFEKLEKLVELNLSNNLITDLPEGIFAPLVNMKRLNLDNNQLRFIHSDSFGVHKTLTWVYINNNRVEGIDEMFIDKTISSAPNVRLLITDNVCYKELFVMRDMFKQKLKKCIDKYERRTKSTRVKCGIPKIQGKGLVYGGSRIPRGAFPWIAVLKDKDQNYMCGGVLISSRKVLTAAHCIQDKSETTRRLARDLSVMLGMHNISNIDSQTKVFSVESASMHPSWNPESESYDADIAVLYLSSYVTFNDYIRPICLIKPGSGAVSIVNGTVVGYGKSADRYVQHIAKELKMPILSNEDCFLNNIVLTSVSSRRTFCAGNGDGKGVCIGDSGSGMYVKYEDAYYLRGIVSSTLLDHEFNCDVNTYAIFTNVVKFYDWIELTGGNPNLYNKKHSN